MTDALDEELGRLFDEAIAGGYEDDAPDDAAAEASGRARGPDGRFVANEQPEAPVEATPAQVTPDQGRTDVAAQPPESPAPTVAAPKSW